MARFRGVFLTSEHAEATAQFYQDVAGLPLERVGGDGYVYWRVDADGIQLAIHDAKAFAEHAYPPMPDSNLIHLYFKITDRDAFLRHLEQSGLAPVAVDDVVITVRDPDGRKVMFGTT